MQGDGDLEMNSVVILISSGVRTERDAMYYRKKEAPKGNIYQWVFNIWESDECINSLFRKGRHKLMHTKICVSFQKVLLFLKPIHEHLVLITPDPLHRWTNWGPGRDSTYQGLLEGDKNEALPLQT